MIPTYDYYKDSDAKAIKELQEQNYLFGFYDQEEMIFDSIDEFITDAVDCGWFEHDLMTVTAYERMAISVNQKTWAAEAALENMLENFDEEYGNPDEATKQTQAMKDHAHALVDAVVKDYKVWGCEPVANIKVDLKRWVSERAKETSK